MKKKKVLILSNHFITLYNFRKELIKELVKSSEVYISIPKSEENSFFTNLGCQIIETEIDRKSKNIFKDFMLIIKYIEIMKYIKPDIIFSYTIKPNIFGSVASNILKIRQINNVTGTGATFINRNMTSEFVKLLYKFSIKNSYKIFFQNNGDLSFFKKEKILNDNYELLPGSGVNLSEFKFSPMKFDNDEIHFIFIGRIMKVKGIEEYLEAAKSIKNKFPNAIFNIAGFIEEKEYLELINEYHNKKIINFLGFQKDIKGVIEKCHCTVLPSHGGEGVPNVLLESAAIGRACIASNIPGSDLVIDNNKNGYLFDAHNSIELSKKLECFLLLNNKNKRKMGEEGRKIVEVEFDRNIVIDKYLEELKGVN